jgi:hypothetical protein
MTHHIQLPKATVQLTEPPTEDLLNTNQTDWDCSDDDLDPKFVGVTIYNLSQGDTVLEKSYDSNHDDWQHGVDTSGLVNSIAFCQSLDNSDWLLDEIDSDNDKDEIISHMCGGYLSTTNDVLAEENRKL